MTKLEYVISLGLRQKGVRGPYSKAAHAAIAKAESEGIYFDEPIVANPNKPKRKRRTKAEMTAAMIAESRAIVEKADVVLSLEPKNKEKPKVSEHRASAPSPLIKRREETILYYLDKGKFSTTLIAFDSCGGCGRSIRFCQHDTPLVPKYLGGKAGLLIKPSMSNA